MWCAALKKFITCCSDHATARRKISSHRGINIPAYLCWVNVVWSCVHDLIQLIYPNLCVGCGDELLGNEKHLCIACWKALPKTGFHHQPMNPASEKFLGKIPFHHAGSMYYFTKDTRLQAILHALKYRGSVEVGIELGKRCAHELMKCPWIGEVDVLVPVPLSKQKMKKRGYNQSEAIARGMQSILAIPTDTTSFTRVVNTRSQTNLSVSERAENVKRAFAVSNDKALRDKHILLIDDVLTTGATLTACAKEILDKVEARISIFTLAYAID